MLNHNAQMDVYVLNKWWSVQEGISKRFPYFSGYIKRSTVKLLLRRMPELNLMDEDFDIEWPSLKEMDLTG